MIVGRLRRPGHVGTPFPSLLVGKHVMEEPSPPIPGGNTPRVAKQVPYE